MRRLAACAVVAALLLSVWTPAASAGSARISIGLVAPLPLLPPIPVPVVVHRPVRPVVVHRPAVIHGHRAAVVHRPFFVATVVPRPVVYPAPAVVYSAPPVAYSAPAVVAPPPPSVVQYPHGRYELQVHGQQYVWVWIPATPPLPPPPPAAAPAPTE
jgi:hypothetical protein